MPLEFLMVLLEKKNLLEVEITINIRSTSVNNMLDVSKKIYQLTKRYAILYRKLRRTFAKQYSHKLFSS